MMENQQNLDQKLEFPWYGYGYQKCMFVDFLSEHASPLNCVLCIVWSTIFTKFEELV